MLSLAHLLSTLGSRERLLHLAIKLDVMESFLRTR